MGAHLGLTVLLRRRPACSYRTVLHFIGSRRCTAVGTCGTVGVTLGLNRRVSLRARSRHDGMGISVLARLGENGRTGEKTPLDMA